MIYIMSAKQTRIPIDSLIFENEDDVVVTDPCYLCNHNIEYDNYWRHERPSSNNICFDYDKFIESETLYGDWGCSMIDESGEEKKVIGEFCADSGMVCITTMSFARWWGVEEGRWDKWVKEHPWSATVIPNFKGKAQITKVIDEGQENEPYIEVELFSPEGKRLYYSTQTSL